MEQPSFFDSLKAGAIGMVKGALMLGSIGLAVGGVIGAALALTSTAPGAALAAAVVSGLAFAEIGVTIGGIIGMFTGIVQSREVQAPDAAKLADIANIAFTQGIEAGRSKSVAREAAPVAQETSTHFRDQLAARQQEASLSPNR